MIPSRFKSDRPAILGMNRRNRDLVEAHNSKRWIGVANDKVETKQRLEALGIPTPKTLGVVQYGYEIPLVLNALFEFGRGFVIKPARSARGRGVTLCERALATEIRISADQSMPVREFSFLIQRMLHGEFSNSYRADQVLVEQRIRPDIHWIFSQLPGAPDLRIILKHGRPVMAMARIPTALSEGRANLHCGAVGVGIDLESEVTTHGVWRDRNINHHPDTREPLEGRSVSGLRECLRIAERCYGAVPLGYMGVDLLLDAEEGPMVIELNARPGLAVQIANQKSILEEILELEKEGL